MSDLKAYQNLTVYYNKILREQKKVILRELKECKQNHLQLTSKLRENLGMLEFRLLVFLIREQSVKTSVNETSRRHNKKLYNLWKQQRSGSPNCITNLSSKTLTILENNALLYGLNHRILPRCIDPIAIKANIDSQIKRICFKHEVVLSFESKGNLREATDRFVNEAERTCNNTRNKFIHRTLSSLSKNKELAVCKMDKGVGVVLMDKKDYFEKLDHIIDDTSRFELIDYDINSRTIKDCKRAPWITKENAVIYYCQKFIKSIVDDQTYWRIYPKGSQPGKLYGTAKNHKDNCPLRPVLSAVNTPEYALAKWLEGKLKPFLSDKHSVTSSSSFVEELCSIKPSPSDVYVSFDIKSLYTNVPLQEVIDDIISTVYSDTAATPWFINSGISKRVLKNILKICSEGIFLYKGKVYQQRDGVAMGSPLAPLLANWFVARVEDKILSNQVHKDYQPVFYKRYVDDVFAIFKSNTERDEFFKILNQSHPNLIFTMEMSTSSLPFLDISVSIKNGSYHTEVYRKETNTGVLMHYNSMAPNKWKRALIKCLISRAYRISSSHSGFINEAEKIKSILAKNGYPISVTTPVIDDYTKRHNITKSNYKRDREPEEKEIKPDDNIKTAYFTIPYIGKPSTKLQNSIRREMGQYQINIMAAYKSTRVGSYFNLKSNCSRPFNSNVVYQFKCSADQNVSYIGETKRQLFRRVADHTKTDKKSAVFEHLFMCTQCQNSKNIMDQFEIIKKCEANNIYSFEALLIAKFKPVLNTQLGPGQGTKTSLALY